MLKPIDQKRLEQFKADLELLGLRFPVAELCVKMNTNRGNLSSYLNGKRPIGDKFWKKFNDTFRNDFERIKNQSIKSEGEKAQEITPIPQVDILSALQDINRRLQKLENICLQTTQQVSTDNILTP